MQSKPYPCRTTRCRHLDNSPTYHIPHPALEVHPTSHHITFPNLDHLHLHLHFHLFTRPLTYLHLAILVLVLFLVTLRPTRLGIISVPRYSIFPRKGDVQWNSESCIACILRRKG